MSVSAGLLGLLGIDLPVIQAPMAGAQGSRLAVAACCAGALGSLPAAMLSPQRLGEEIETIRAQTDRPFNVNFFAHRQLQPSSEIQQAWWQALKPYYDEFGLTQAVIEQGGARQPFSADMAELVERYRLPIVSFHFGLPEQVLLNRVKAAGSVILATATTVAEAEWLVARGVDVIVAQGLEAGGHRGMFLNNDLTTQSGLLSLVPQIRAAVAVPVVAAGGVGDAATAAAARALGAAAVQAGTAFLLADEAEISPLYRAALQSECARHTAITNLFSGGYARGIVNRFIREAGPINPAAPVFPHAATLSAPLRQAAEAQGSDAFSPFWSGQNAVLARPVSAAVIVRELAAGFMT